MHELGMVQSIVEKLLAQSKKEKMKKIKEVELTVGSNSGIKEEELKFCFSLLAKNTILENANLKIISGKTNLVEIVAFTGE